VQIENIADIVGVVDIFI